MKHSLLKALVIGIISTVLVIPFTFTELYRALELRFYDQRLKLRPLRPVSGEVVVIAIDDNSIKTLGRWPWSRDRHAILIDTLTSLGAKGIFLDIEFLEESPSTLEKTVVASSLKEVKESLQHLQSISDPAKTGQVVSPTQLASSFLKETRAMEETLEGMLKDYDKELARSIALSGRTYLAFHPIDPLPPESPLRPLYPSLKGVLTREDVTSAEGLAGKLPLNKKQSKELVEYFPFLKKQVLLELVEAEIKKNPDITLVELETALPWKRKGEVEEAYRKARLMQYVEERFGKEIKIIGPFPGGQPHSAPYLEVPILPLLEVSKGIGHTAIVSDREDGVVRSLPLLVQRNGRYFPNLALQAVCNYLGVGDGGLTLYPGRYLSLHPASGGEIEIPVNPSGQALVDFAGRPGHLGWNSSFSTISYLLPLELSYARRDLALLQEALDQKYNRGSIGRLRQILSTTTSPEERQELEGEIIAKERNLESFIKLSIEKTRSSLQKTEGEKGERLATALQEMEQELFTITRLKEREKDLFNYLKERVEGKTCLVGAFFTGGTDFYSTPYDPSSPGIILHCNFINMVLNKSFLKYDEKRHNLPILVLVGPVIALITMAVGSLRGGGALAGLIGLYLGISFLLLNYYGVWLHVAGPLITMITSYTAVTVYRQLTEERMRRQIKHLFQHYLHPTVVNELIKDPKKLRLGGERKELTVYFSDLQGFTPIAESMSPEELEKLLNVYLSTITDIILQYGGTVDKYEGDAIMAFYGAPVEQKDHALRACKAALESIKAMEKLNSQFKKRGWPSLRVRTGINTGTVVVGNMGTSTRFDYTVIGDSVNLASRLEGANKTFHTSILVGHETFEQIKDEVLAFYLGLVRVKGKTSAIGVYEPIATIQEVTQKETEVGRLLYQGIRCYQKGDWEPALGNLSRVLELRPDYGPALMYSRRCHHHMEKPPAPGWAGEIVLEEK